MAVNITKLLENKRIEKQNSNSYWWYIAGKTIKIAKTDADINIQH